MKSPNTSVYEQASQIDHSRSVHICKQYIIHAHLFSSVKAEVHLWEIVQFRIKFFFKGIKNVKFTWWILTNSLTFLYVMTQAMKWGLLVLYGMIIQHSQV